jgi:hypothetical protein
MRGFVGRAPVAGSLLAAAAVAAVSLVPFSSGQARAQHLANPSVQRPCVGARPPVRYAHVIWIFMENKSFDQVIGNEHEAPYLNAFAKSCALALDYSAISHPSLPNYLAATSGDTWRIADDGYPGAHPLSVPSIYSQVAAAGLTWRDYEENVPGGCPSTDAGLYGVEHDPAAYFTRIRAACARWDVPLSALALDLAHDSLPTFALVTPNECHDTHTCSIGAGDTWLAKWIPKIISSRAYRAGTTTVFLVWDEGESTDNRVALIAAAQSVRPGAISRRLFDHYSLLKTTEQLLRLRMLAHAADPSTASMAGAFHLVAF